MCVIWRSALSLASRDRLSILIFHRILRKPDPLLPSEPTAEQFEALLRHLKARFTVLPLLDAVRCLYSGTLPASALAITFDDGYADNLAVAAPILRRNGIPATVFIATGYLDGGCMWNDLVIEAFRSTHRSELDLTDVGAGRHALASIDDRRAAIDRVLVAIKYLAPAQRVERARVILQSAGVSAPVDLMLTRSSLRSLIEFGFEIGAHTISHPILARVPASDAWREISESKQDLEGLLDRAVTLFAYPNGQPYRDYTHEHVRMVREAGFAAALSTARGAASPKSDVLQLPRFTPWSRHPMKFDLLMLRNLCTGVERQAA
jgi:peptidoglycan/xylan/chitin deacetylase (PgdA/CDA1 family)